MRKLIILFFALTFSQFCLSQNDTTEFSGIIKYKNEFEITGPPYDIHYLILHKGTDAILYYKEGKYRYDFCIDGVRIHSVFQFKDSLYSYHIYECADTITAYLNKTHEINVVKSELKCKVLDYECENITIISGSRFEYSFFYSKDLPYHDKSVPNQSFYKAVYSNTNSHYLKHITKKTGPYKYTSISTAISVINKELSDSVFMLPNCIIVRNPPPKFSNYYKRYNNIADNLLRCGDYKNASVMYNRAVEYDSYDNGVLFNRAISYLKQNKFLKACDDFALLKKKNDNEAISLYKKYCNCNILKSYYHNELIKLIGEQNYDKAITYFNYVIECNEKDTNAIFNRAISKYNNNQKIDAFEDILLSYKLGDNEVAKFINKNYNKEELGKAYFKLGNKYFIQKDYKKAIEYFSTVLNSFPNSVAALRKRGLAYKKTKEKEKACIDFKKASSLNDEESKKMMKKCCE